MPISKFPFTHYLDVLFNYKLKLKCLHSKTNSTLVASIKATQLFARANSALNNLLHQLLQYIPQFNKVYMVVCLNCKRTILFLWM